MVFFLCCGVLFPQQRDSLYGKVKSIREKLIYPSKEDKDFLNKNLISIGGDYGEFGIISPKSEREGFVDSWYDSPWVSYVNFYEEFNKKGKPTYEVWYHKNGDTVSSYRYKYDKKDNLIQYKDIYKPDDYTSRNYTYNSKNKVLSSLYYASSDPNLYSYRAYVYDSVAIL